MLNKRLLLGGNWKLLLFLFFFRVGVLFWVLGGTFFAGLKWRELLFLVGSYFLGVGGNFFGFHCTKEAGFFQGGDYLLWLVTFGTLCS